MALTTWKSSDNLVNDLWPYSYRCDLVPYWRRNSYYRDDFSLSPRVSPRRFELSRLEQRLHGEIYEISSRTDYSGYHLVLDVSQFNPNEVTVRTTTYSVTVEGKYREANTGDGYITRESSRRYVLPSGYDTSRITSNLSSDGCLTVKVPWAPWKNL